MDAHTQSHTSDPAPAPVDTAPAPAFVQVLYVGGSGGAELVEALRRDGVGVIVAFDHERAARMLRHFRPDAILCAPADAGALVPCAEPNVPVLTLPYDDQRRSLALESTSVNVAGDVASDAAATAHRIREEIAARR
jgi:hypothetical protein